MNKNQKQAIVGLLSGIGVIVLLLGIFTEIYVFTTGLIIAIAIWILNGVLAKYWGVKD